MKDTELIMVLLHSMQAEAWSDQILEHSNTIQEFKYRLKNLRNHSKLFNDYCVKVMGSDAYEVSAEVSDSFLQMAKLPMDEIEKLTQIINNYCEDYGKNKVS